MSEVKYDNISKPFHYNQFSHEVIELTECLGFCLGNAVKYILRAPFKGKEVEDLQKAKWYLNRIKDHGVLETEVLVDETYFPEIQLLAASYGDEIVLGLIKAATYTGWDYTPDAELEYAIEQLDYRISEAIDKKDGEPKQPKQPEKPKKSKKDEDIAAVLKAFEEFTEKLKRI